MYDVLHLISCILYIISHISNLISYILYLISHILYFISYLLLTSPPSSTHPYAFQLSVLLVFVTVLLTRTLKWSNTICT